MTTEKTCKVCGERFTKGWSSAMYCSDACKQKAYRNRKTTVTKKVNKACVRCGKSSGKSMYCSSSCKIMTNREKQASTVRTIRAIEDADFEDVWFKCSDNWKDAYGSLESKGYIYKPYLKRWINPASYIELPGFVVDVINEVINS